MDTKYKNHDCVNTPTRRAFITRIGGAIVATATLPTASLAANTNLSKLTPRDLTLHHLHTGEKLQATYWHGGDYDGAALAAIDAVLRDFRTGDIHPIERRLLDILHIVQTEIGVDAPYQVIGGYRSPKTNNMLRKRSTGVAKRSLHMEGRAIDIRIPGVNSNILREAAADLHLGGVGYYRSSDFVHLDTGRPRVW